MASSGTLPNITRNALVNCTELVTYDLIKEAILRHNLLSGEWWSPVTNTHNSILQRDLIGQKSTHPLTFSTQLITAHMVVQYIVYLPLTVL